jgi:hypothetical protein
MPSAQGTKYDSVEQAEAQYVNWPFLRCSNKRCNVRGKPFEHHTFAKDEGTPCPYCAQPPQRPGEPWIPVGFMTRVPLRESDPYLFPDEEEQPLDPQLPMGN